MSPTRTPRLAKAVVPRPSRLPIEAARERVLALLADPAPMQGPALDPCVCGAGRHAHSGAAGTGKCVETGCARYRRDPVDMLVEKALRGLHASLADDLIAAEEIERRDRPKPVEGGWGVGPSDAGGCRAQVGFRERGWGTDPEHRVHSERGDAEAPEGATFYPLDSTDYTAARIGTVIHADVLRRRKSLYPHRQYGDLPGMSIAIPGLDRHGRYDEFDPITCRLTDVKTAGKWKWDVVESTGPDLWQWRQLSIYGLALVRQGYIVREIEVLYVERAGGRDLSFVRPFDERLAQEALTWLLNTAAALDTGEPLERDRPGPSLDGLCRRCEFRSACWQVPAALAAGRSPEGWVRLGANPDDAAIIPVFEEYDAARQAEKEGKAAKEAAKTHLDGLPYREYGDPLDPWVYGFSGGNRLDDEPDLEARAAQLADEMHDAIAEGRPPRDPFDLPHPMRERHSRKSVQVKRLPQTEKRKRAKAAGVPVPTTTPAPAAEPAAVEQSAEQPTPAPVQAGPYAEPVERDYGPQAGDGPQPGDDDWGIEPTLGRSTVGAA